MPQSELCVQLTTKQQTDCIGAVYCDAVLRLGGFDGEGLQSSSVLVVKSHGAVPSWSRKLNHVEFKGTKVETSKLVSFC